MLADRSTMPVSEKIEIDLLSSNGNAFVLIGICRDLGRKMGKTYAQLQAEQTELMSSDYEHLLSVVEKYYGDHINMYR